jgi:simple sugar transport system ATP-binding protein
VLEVRGLQLAGGSDHEKQTLSDVSFEVRAGEIVGVAGVEGNGQTELLEVLAGLRRATGGTILFNGRNCGGLPGRRLKELGIAHVPEDRHRRGLLLNFDLADNSILGTHYRPPIAREGLGLLDEAAVATKTNRVITEFDVRPPDADLPARALSGGNQQKLVIGREFDIHPKLLLVAQPTRGVDIGAIEFIHAQLVALRDRGAAILLVSAELEEVVSLADRILVMYQGRIAGEVTPGDVDEEEIGLLMTGGRASI